MLKPRVATSLYRIIRVVIYDVLAVRSPLGRRFVLLLRAVSRGHRGRLRLLFDIRLVVVINFDQTSNLKVFRGFDESIQELLSYLYLEKERGYRILNSKQDTA